MADTPPSPHIVVVSSPGIGHVTPLAELTKLLVLRHHFTATIVTFSDLPTCSLPSSISTLQLPLLPPHSLPPHTHFVTRICLAMTHSIPFLREILISVTRTTRLAAVFFDLFGIYFLSMGKSGIPTYLLITSNLFYLSFMLHLPALAATTTAGEFRDLPEPLNLPGCVPLKGKDFLEPLQERNSEVCAGVIHRARHFDLFDGILVNSFEALEPGAAMFLKNRGGGTPPVWPIGPLIWSDSNVGSEKPSHECIEWLDKQSSGSVVFLCFGSGGALSWQQTRELAIGLEMSGQRFLWVVRGVSDIGSSDSFLNPNHGEDEDDDPLRFLPKGFVERIKGRGMVVRSWAPQREVLSHFAVGGFVSHCGWNSTLESLMNGVPMAAWPLYSEQRMNAVLLVDGVKVALRVNVGEDGTVGREEIAKVVKMLMEGEEGKVVRQKMREMKTEAAIAEGKQGSSHNALKEVVSILKDSDSAKPK
ncbi:LOW QUALITY PROTEIN: hydroquinone glucosyltransferase-like [Phalaenopsis equestris]|uniref:LOW QUALITY PROTEIN: hydroquinone glucosyltransferase-like n=1 Tax=Phalaenopsis equestris TaxID=78828 RepID=UPI0009E3064C|nr:LOW QUALITY PROTEIN: hydroquinone glucosyltransferase-like [Phalaenopsis equestris]